MIIIIKMNYTETKDELLLKNATVDLSLFSDQGSRKTRFYGHDSWTFLSMKA